MIDMGVAPNYQEMIDMVTIQGIYVTKDPRTSGYDSKLMMWCGYCCQPLPFDHRHMGETPFLSLMAKMADAHRHTDCPKPQGPFDHTWNPRISSRWLSWSQERLHAERIAREENGGMYTELVVG